jgi:hypothetical protein
MDMLALFPLEFLARNPARKPVRSVLPGKDVTVGMKHCYPAKAGLLKEEDESVKKATAAAVAASALAVSNTWKGSVERS